MHRDDAIMWTARGFAVAYIAAVAWDAAADGNFSSEIRYLTMAVMGLVFVTLCAWQVMVALAYEGIPVVPLPFRWVTALWFGALALLLGWLILWRYVPEVYTEYRAALVWCQAGVATLWWAARWVTVGSPHVAGVGETGTGGNGNGGTA